MPIQGTIEIFGVSPDPRGGARRADFIVVRGSRAHCRQLSVELLRGGDLLAKNRVDLASLDAEWATRFDLRTGSGRRDLRPEGNREIVVRVYCVATEDLVAQIDDEPLRVVDYVRVSEVRGRVEHDGAESDHLIGAFTLEGFAPPDCIEISLEFACFTRDQAGERQKLGTSDIHADGSWAVSPSREQIDQSLCNDCADGKAQLHADLFCVPGYADGSPLASLILDPLPCPVPPVPPVPTPLPDPHCPAVSVITASPMGPCFDPNQEIIFTLGVHDPDGCILKYDWVLTPLRGACDPRDKEACPLPATPPPDLSALPLGATSHPSLSIRFADGVIVNGERHEIYEGNWSLQAHARLNQDCCPSCAMSSDSLPSPPFELSLMAEGNCPAILPLEARLLTSQGRRFTYEFTAAFSGNTCFAQVIWEVDGDEVGRQCLCGHSIVTKELVLEGCDEDLPVRAVLEPGIRCCETEPRPSQRKIVHVPKCGGTGDEGCEPFWNPKCWNWCAILGGLLMIAIVAFLVSTAMGYFADLAAEFPVEKISEAWETGIIVSVAWAAIEGLILAYKAACGTCWTGRVLVAAAALAFIILLILWLADVITLFAFIGGLVGVVRFGAEGLDKIKSC